MPTDRTLIAIEINRRALLRVMREIGARMPDGDGILTRGVWLTVLALLRPAESAARRLIALMARRMMVLPSPPVKGRARFGKRKGGGGTGKRYFWFGLFDRRTKPGASRKKRKGKKPDPNIRDILLDGPTGETPCRAATPDDAVDAETLRERIDALRRALDDIPKLALRLARTYADGKAKWLYPIRIGRPPGWREGGKRPVDVVLADCNGLYWIAVKESERAPP